MKRTVRMARRAEVTAVLRLAGVDLYDGLPAPKYVWNRTGTQKGTVINPSARTCRCGHPQASVRWPDRKVTYPCRNAMFMRSNGDWQIC